MDGLNAIPGITCKKSAGSFYAFPNIKAFGKTSQAFAEELLENAGVVTVPGSAFGDMGEGYLRLVFANSDENLKEAVRRIADLCGPGLSRYKVSSLECRPLPRSGQRTVLRQ